MRRSLFSIVTASVLLSGTGLVTAGAAYAADTNPATRPATTGAAVVQPSAASADVNKLIGRNIQNLQNETIGEINSVRIGTAGNVEAVIVGVGGFLGMGEREVAINWKDLTVADNGNKVTLAMTKEQLKAMPEYKYPDASYRGRVYGDSGVRDTPATREVAASRDRTVTNTTTRGDFNAQGEISSNALIGATVKNANDETVGKVEDVFLDTTGGVKGLIVSVGGFLGMASHDVMMSWKDIKVSRQKDKLVLMTPATKESLKSMPEYK
jgi:sporulation protein YlmC with PRC-barrel domain